jgi:hypothetical protein
MTAIKAEEIDAAPDVEPIEWYLLTTLPVEKLEDAKLYVKFYSYRWLIERFHYTLKSGCQIEKLELQDIKRINNAIATYSIVSMRILYMTYLARIEPDSDASEILSNDEIEILLVKFRKKSDQSESLTVQQAVILIARLGGFMGRKSDGMPGVKTLWRGLFALINMVDGWLLAKNHYANLAKNNFPSEFINMTYG